jgi:hypothetical protein
VEELVQVFVDKMDMAGQKSNGANRIVANTDAQTLGHGRVRDRISRDALIGQEKAVIAVLNHAPRISDIPVPSVEHTHRRPHTADRPESQVLADAMRASAGARLKRVPLLSPHGWNCWRVRRAHQRGCLQNRNTEIAFKLGDVAEVTLVLVVCSLRPSVEHINQSGAFESQQSQVFTVQTKFALKNSANSTRFADETGQHVDLAREL